MTDNPPILRVQVAGKPAPGGSKRAFAHATTGRVIVLDDCKRNKSWRSVVAAAAAEAMRGRPVERGPLAVEVEFTILRPRSHYRVGRYAHVVRDAAPAHPTTKPDATKLWRAAEDAISGVVWADDSQIVQQCVRKVYGDKPGMTLVVWRMS